MTETELRIRHMEERLLRAEAILRLARDMTKSHCRGMKDDDRHKGIGNYLADALWEYDSRYTPAFYTAASSKGTGE